MSQLIFEIQRSGHESFENEIKVEEGAKKFNKGMG